MFRIGRFLKAKLRGEGNENLPSLPKPIEVDVDECDSLRKDDPIYDDTASLTDSASEDSYPRPPTYQTHSFQQRFVQEHPAPGATPEAFASFMKRVAATAICINASSRDDDDKDVAAVSRPTSSSSVWWNYQRDFDETKEDESIVFEDANNDTDPVTSTEPKGRELSSDDTVYNDFFYGFGDGNTSHLFAHHTILHDLGSRKTNSRHPVKNACMGEAADDVETVEFEPSTPFEDVFQPRVAFNDSADHPTDGKIYENASFDSDCTPPCSTEFELDAPVRVRQPKAKTKNRWFGNVALVTPEVFDNPSDTTAKEALQQIDKVQSPSSMKPAVVPVTLSSMIHPLDQDMFKRSAEDLTVDLSCSKDSVSSISDGSSTPSTKRHGSVYKSEQYTYPSKNLTVGTKTRLFDSIRKKLASSFRSKASGCSETRVRYSLALDKPSMTRRDRALAATLLPRETLVSFMDQQESATSASIPRSVSCVCDRTLSILLLHTTLKIFEIVRVEYSKDTTVGDTLSKARASATDEILAEQKYVSLCNRKQEIAAPMLPVSLLVKSSKGAMKTSNSDSDDSSINSKEDQDRLNRREMEARLLVAVPEGSTAVLCQAVRRALWKNPKIQRWWKLSDPFNPTMSRSSDKSRCSRGVRNHDKVKVKPENEGRAKIALSK